MKYSILLISFTLCFLYSVICPAGMQLVQSQTQFQVAIGSLGDDGVNSIVQTRDSGYVMAGYTTSFGAGYYDMYIVKIDGSGTLQWSITIGGSGDDRANSIIRTTDGGYAIAGYTSSFGAGQYDMYVVKLNSSGTLQWSKTVGGIGDDRATSIVQTTDGGYAVAGWTTSFGAGGFDVYVVKLDGSGTLQWSKTVGGTDSDYATSIIQNRDGSYAIFGMSASFGNGNYDMYVVKLNNLGTIQWSNTFGGAAIEYATSIIQTTDGGYAAAGYTYSFGAGGFDMLIIKLDSIRGGLQWSRTVGGGGATGHDFANSIIQTPDGGFAVAGYTQSFGEGPSDMYVVKLGSGGSLQWSKTVGGTNIDVANSIIQTPDGGFAVAGYTNSFGAGGNDMYIVKLDGSINICGTSSTPSSISGSGGDLRNFTSTVTSPSPTVTSPSSSTGTGGTLTTICVIGIQPISNEIPGSYELYQNYPNPFNPTTKIKIQISKLADTKVTVYDILGREVEVLINEQLKPGTYEVEWNAANYTSGVYFYKLAAGDFVETKKMLLVK